MTGKPIYFSKQVKKKSCMVKLMKDFQANIDYKWKIYEKKKKSCMANF